MAGNPPVRHALFETAPGGRGVTLSVVIPATDRPETLQECVAAIRRADDPPEEVIVIDSPPGLGPAGARNAGAVRATGSVLVFVDSDVLVHPDVFRRIRATFEREPALAAVFGSYDDAPSIHGIVSTFRNTLHHYVHQGSPGAATTFWAGLGAVRREAFVAVDGFDDWRFRRPSIEDLELGLRLAVAGRHIRLDPSIQGRHLKRWRVSTMMVTDLIHRGAPWTAVMLTHGPRAARLNVRGSHLLAVAAFSGGLLASGLGRRRLAASLIAGYLALNTRFYNLILRTAGPRAAGAAVLLLATHNATALGAVPLGLARFAYEHARPGHEGTPLATCEAHEQRVSESPRRDDRPQGVPA